MEHLEDTKCRRPGNKVLVQTIRGDARPPRRVKGVECETAPPNFHDAGFRRSPENPRVQILAPRDGIVGGPQCADELSL